MRDTRTPDQLLRDAVAIRTLLDETDEADHAARIRLVASQDRVRLEAAQQWHARGWRPITEAEVVRSPDRTLLLAPLLVVAGAAALSRFLLSTGDPTLLLLLVGLSAAPLVAELSGAGPSRVRRLAAVAAVALSLHLATGPIPSVLVFLPGTALLAAIAVAGVAPRRQAVPTGSMDSPAP